MFAVLGKDYTLYNHGEIKKHAYSLFELLEDFEYGMKVTYKPYKNEIDITEYCNDCLKQSRALRIVTREQFLKFHSLAFDKT